MKMIKTIAVLAVCAVGQVSVNAYAQINPNNPLVIFVEDPANGATDLQRSVGIGVADVCPSLGGFGQAPGPSRDLFLRCNEMIATACTLNGAVDPVTGLPVPCGRSLEFADPDELLAALQQIWGEEQHSNSTLTARVTNGQFSNIAGRLNALRLGGASAALGGRVASVAPDSDPARGSPAYAGVSLDSRSLTGGGAAGDADVAGSRVGWFLEGSFNTGDRDQTASEDGFDFDATSFTLGLDYLFDTGVIGVSIGVDNYEADFDNALLVTGGEVEVDGTSGSIFGAWFGQGFYLDGLVTFGQLDSDISRRVVYDSNGICAPDPCPPQDRDVTGSTDGDYLAAGATLGYEAVRGNWDITTSLSLAYRDIDIDGYDEVDSSGGGLGLSYEEQSIESLRSILGFAFTGNFSREFGVLSPQFRVEWHHEFEDDPIQLAAKYTNDSSTGSACLSCVRFNSDKIDTDFALVGIGLSAVFSQRTQIYFVYDALLGLDNLSSNAFSVGIRSQF